LIESARAESVCADDAGLESAFLVIYCKLRACGCFAITLWGFGNEVGVGTDVLDLTCKPTAMITFGCPFFGLYGSTPGSTS
jgi:hypothetical protein